MDEDIPLSVDLPAVALKLAQRPMSWLHVINDRFNVWASRAGRIGNSRNPPAVEIQTEALRVGRGR